MRLLSTKILTPQQQLRCKEAGYDLTLFEALTIKRTQFDIPTGDHSLIFTSQNAVKSLKVFLQKYFLAIHQSKKIAAIGHKTSDALGAMGFQVAARANNALALAEEINNEFFKTK